MNYYKYILEAHIDYMNEIIKNIEYIKERSKKTIEDCDKVLDDIEFVIKDFRN